MLQDDCLFQYLKDIFSIFAVFAAIALIVPASLIVASYNTDYIPAICSSNITSSRITNNMNGWRAVADTTEAGTGYHIRLSYPAFQGLEVLVGSSERAVSAWIARISAGSPTASFTCLVRHLPSNDTTAEGISERQLTVLAGWIVAMVFSSLIMLSLMLIFCCYCAAPCYKYSCSKVNCSCPNPNQEPEEEPSQPHTFRVKKIHFQSRDLDSEV
jgi:hypothetical protein